MEANPRKLILTAYHELALGTYDSGAARAKVKPQTREIDLTVHVSGTLSIAPDTTAFDSVDPWRLLVAALPYLPKSLKVADLVKRAYRAGKQKDTATTKDLAKASFRTLFDPVSRRGRVIPHLDFQRVA